VSVEAVLETGTGSVAVATVALVGQEVPVLVDDAVAVVIDLVAGLGHRCAYALRRIPLAMAVLTMLPAGTGMSTDAAVGVVGGQVEPVIDHAITVVVDAVTDFGCRCAIGLRQIPGALAGDAGLARPANPSADPAIVRVGQQVEAIVDDSITVVVLIVAGFHGRRAVERRHDVLAVAGLTDLTRTASSSAGAAVGRVALEVEVLVDNAVAIVIDAVTDLRAGNAAVLRCVPLAVPVAAGLPDSASVAAGAAVGRIGEEVEPLIDETVAVVVNPVTHFRRRCAGALRQIPGAGTVFTVLPQGAGMSADAAVGIIEEEVEPLVDESVAVVVRVVADFAGRRSAEVDRVVPGTIAILAMLPGSASMATETAVGRIAEEVEVLVDQTIAVVVDVIAYLRAGYAIVLGDVPGAAATDTMLTGCADPAASTAVGIVAEEVEPLVDDAVAVVVDVVAYLGRRYAVVLRHDPGTVAVAADLVGRASVAADAAVGRIVTQHESLIDDAIAVVVDVVALFGHGRATALRCIPGTGPARAVLVGRASMAANAAVGYVGL